MMVILMAMLVYVSQAYGNCMSDKNTATQNGKQATPIGQEGQAVENAAAANASAQASQSVNPNANLSSAAGAQCAQGHSNALSKLKAFKQKCNVACSCDPYPSSDQAQKGPCEQAKAECNRQYDEQIAQSSGGQAGCQQAKDGADKTSEESKGGAPPQMPQMPKGEDDPVEPEKAVAPAAAITTDCSKADSHNNPDCNDKMVKDCANSSSGKCESFGFRYCTPSASGGTGEGIGSELCKKRVAEKFCSEEGKNICPTCKQMQIQNSEVCKDRSAPCVSQTTAQQLVDAKKSCPTDPIFTDPKLASGSAGSSTGGSSGGAGGGGMESAGTPSVAEETKKSDGATEYKKLDTSTDGGGGGFSGYGSTKSSSESDSSSFSFKGINLGGGKKPASVPGPAVEASMLTPEVHKRTSKSLFTMSSEVYKDRCSRGLINHCGPD